jgi:hypothetical protein
MPQQTPVFVGVEVQKIEGSPSRAADDYHMASNKASNKANKSTNKASKSTNKATRKATHNATHNGAASASNGCEPTTSDIDNDELAQPCDPCMYFILSSISNSIKWLITNQQSTVDKCTVTQNFTAQTLCTILLETWNYFNPLSLEHWPRGYLSIY